MSRIKVLIVDDEEEFALALVERLMFRNYDVSAVHGAENAFTFIRRNPPDIVLLDLKMPEMNGIEVLKILKEFDPIIEVIIITGHGHERERIEAEKRGAFDFLVKPVSIRQITEKIDQASKKRVFANRYLNSKKV